MSFATPEEARKHRNIYLMVFLALAGLTAVTVIIAQVHLPTPYAIAAAMFVATIKGSLVACYFMHLLTENKVLYSLLALCALFFAVMILLPVFTDVEAPWHALLHSGG